ncbi:MAG: LuxR C-terminal-related transcriptional regulator [Candidatus Gastranaerophilales bacterium]|nr:LuxR C-terminal-related transcriptional regulator [Candidatus Gastranaerophilales bacterium]
MDIRNYFKNKKLDEILTKKLTSREVRILKMYANGFSVKEITEILTISESTVRTHIKNVYTKVKIDDSADCKMTLCLFWHLYRPQLEKKEGLKKCRK